MLFWILIGLIVAITAFVVVMEASDSYGSPFIGGIVTLVISATVGFFVAVVVCAIARPPLEAVPVGEKTQQLRALGNANGLEGRSYFLGGGYVKDKRVLNFITNNEGGAIKVERADAEDSVIYEDSTAASVKVTHVDYVNGWIAPFPLGDSHKYEFHIPAGSVVESYTLDNK